VRKFLFSASALALACAFGGAAHAVPTVSIQWQEDAGAFNSLVPTANLPPGNYTYNATGALYTFNGSLFGSPLLPQGFFNTSNQNVKYNGADGAHTLTVWITEQNLTVPVGPATFSAAFTTNSWSPAGVTKVTEDVYVSTANALFGGTLIGTQTFNSQVDADGFAWKTLSLAGPYSETVKYTIYTAQNGAASNNTINVSVPEPGSLALIGVGLIGLGLLARRGQYRVGFRAAA
jgi:hypothetical protein